VPQLYFTATNVPWVGEVPTQYDMIVCVVDGQYGVMRNDESEPEQNNLAKGRIQVACDRISLDQSTVYAVEAFTEHDLDLSYYLTGHFKHRDRSPTPAYDTDANTGDDQPSTKRRKMGSPALGKRKERG
jgi:hypothetical protein